MVKKRPTNTLSDKNRLSRSDWLESALRAAELGVDKVKVAPMAESMGVTTGSFYWHFRNRQELLDAMLVYWEVEKTDVPIAIARQYDGPAADRILFLMESVLVGDMAVYDLPIAQWAKENHKVKRVFNRAVKKRFDFATWMFAEAGFAEDEAVARGRLMVTYMMAESSFVNDSLARRNEQIKHKHSILLAPP